MNEVELSPTLIIGAGMIGASVGCALTQAGITVHLTDLVTSHARVAASRGAGTAAPVDPALVKLVVVAVPPTALADTIADALASYPHATVTDVGSVKGTILTDLRSRGLDLSRYVGSHPMAGSHLPGPLMARADLFVDRTWVVTPHDTSRAHGVLAVQKMVQICRAREVSMGATHHDEAVAQVSHLPQVMSELMAGRLTEVPDAHLQLAGQGVRDVTRIAGSDPLLWTQIIEANADAVFEELVAVRDDLAELLANWGDHEALTAFLRRGREGFRALPGKHGAVAAEYAIVSVEIPDAPGALARLFADIEAAGVNVEDVRIEHSLDRSTGFLSVQVLPEAVDALESAMRKAGWTLRYQPTE